MFTTKEQTDSLNSLLRGELAAIQTYRQALNQVEDEPGMMELVRIEDEHWDAADLLGERVIERGGRPASSSGAWGAFAQGVEGMARLFGDTAALKVLREGERHGIRKYEDALSNDHVDAETKMLIRASLLPKQRTHVMALDRLLGSGGGV